MKKPNLSSEAIKEFFLYHVEKLVFALGVILLGLFFWLGYQTKTFDKTDPKGLVSQTQSARQYIVRTDAWEQIAPLREGDDEVMTRIASAKEISSAAFEVGPTSYPVKRDSLRRDMEIARPENLVATVFSTQILVEPDRKIVDGLLEYEIAEVKIEEDDDRMGPGGMGPGGMGPGGMGPGGMGNGPGGMGPGGMGPGMDGGETAAEKRKRERREKAEEVNAGAFVSTAVKYRFKGIRPKSFSPTTVAAFNIDAVAVTGVINHKAMWKNFRDSYSKSFGFFPRRDTPVYDYLQIERREVGADGKPMEWLDISDQIAEQAEFFPASMKTAPEVVAPPEYDGIITMPIPPLTGIDYKDFATHVLASLREFIVEEVEEEATVDNDTIFAKDDTDDDGMNSQYDNRSRRRQSAIDSGNGAGRGMGMGMGMGMGPGGMGMGPGDMGMGPGGPGGMGPGGMGMGMGMGGMTGAGRRASNTSDFAKIDITEEPESDIKVVRFFDMQVKSNKTYQYRVRVWVRDPNNEDPELARNSGSGDMGMGGPGMGGPGMGGPGMGGPGMGGRSRGGRNSGGNDKGKDGDDAEAEKVYKKTPIASSMIDPKSRERIKLGREEEVDGETVYYVSEKFDPSGDYVEVKVPKGHEYLRYARPSQWSDLIDAKVQTKDSFVYAGDPIEVRRIDLQDDVSIPAGEPEMNIAAVKALRGGKLSGVKIPIRTKVRRGELLNFNEPAHVLHPVTWQVHKVTKLPVRTNQIVLDISGGDRLGIKRSEPIQYQFPGEALVMDSNGNIELRNDLEDRGRYLAAALETDEKAEFGGKRKARREAKEKADAGFGMGGPGMGGMGPGMGGGGPDGGRGGGRGGRTGGRGGR